MGQRESEYIVGTGRSEVHIPDSMRVFSPVDGLLTRLAAPLLKQPSESDADDR